MATEPVHHVVNFLLALAIRDKFTELQFDPGVDGGTFVGRSTIETVELIPPPAMMIRNLIAEFARLADIVPASSPSTGSFVRREPAFELQCIGDWIGPPIEVHVTLTNERFHLRLSHPGAL